MKLGHPYHWLAEKIQSRAFFVMLPLTLFAMWIEQVTGAPLKTDVASSGILSFEFAGTLAHAQAMVQSWGQPGQVYAGLNIGFDFFFIPAYVICIGLGCVIVARGGFATSLGVILAWAMLVAGLLDCVENYNLIQILLGYGQESNALIAQGCAAPKFAIVGISILYVLVGAVTNQITSRRGARIAH